MRALAGLFLLLPLAAHADAPTPDQNKATLLFDEAKAARDAGRIDEACEKFEQSLKLDRLLGTMLNLADCREAQGRLLDAHALFSEGIDLAVKGDKKVRETYARQHADALVGKLARVTVKAQAMPGLAVQLDGKPVELAKQRVVMPGRITVTATADGRQPVTIERDVTAGSEQTIDVAFAAPQIDRPPPPKHGGRSKLPYIVGGGGLALVVTSGVLALGAKSSYDDAVSDNAADTDARIDKAQKRADLATVVGAVGVIGVGVGVVLYLRRPGGVVVAPTAQRDAVGVALTRSF